MRFDGDNVSDRKAEDECAAPVVRDLDPVRLQSANIHPNTLLATDYLNHFNEVVMLLDLLADMPELAVEVVAWEPRSYVDHFRASRFRERDLAIEAYESVEPVRRAAFETTVRAIDDAVADLQRLITGAPMEALPVGLIADHAELQVKPLLAHAMGLINGAPPVARVTEEGGEAQSAVDALFP
jgi:hypothetical protein